MPLWKGTKGFVDTPKPMRDGVRDKMCKVPSHPLGAPRRMRKFKRGQCCTFRPCVPGVEVVFVPTHTAVNPYTSKVLMVEVQHQCLDKACPGDALA